MQVITTCAKCKFRWGWDTEAEYPPPLCPGCGYDTIWSGRRSIERPLRAGSQLRLRSEDHSVFRPVDRAVVGGKVDDLRKLIHEGADILTGASDDGETPLHLLALTDVTIPDATRVAAAQMLLDAGADRLARTLWNEIPHDLAVHKKRSAKLIALLDPDTPLPIALRCPECGHQGHVPPDRAGTAVRCKCGHTFQVPGESRAAEPAAQTQPDADPVAQARAWCEQSRAQGQTDDQIAAVLRQSGWSDDDIAALLAPSA